MSSLYIKGNLKSNVIRYDICSIDVTKNLKFFSFGKTFKVWYKIVVELYIFLCKVISSRMIACGKVCNFLIRTKLGKIQTVSQQTNQEI